MIRVSSPEPFFLLFCSFFGEWPLLENKLILFNYVTTVCIMLLRHFELQ